MRKTLEILIPHQAIRPPEKTPLFDNPKIDPVLEAQYLLSRRRTMLELGIPDIEPIDQVPEPPAFNSRGY